jgi:hypothetical protein
MAKQPYIPFYIGDYIKDTRRLPLAVRGAWVDLLLFMWDEPIKGEIVGTIEEFSGMLSCTKPECEFALGLLIEKGVCNHEKLAGEKIKIISRRMKKDADISLKRSLSGKTGVKEKAKRKQKQEFVDDLQQANQKQNPDIEYDNGIDDRFTSFEGAGNFSFDSTTILPALALEAAEMNQFTHTKKRNTEFVQEQWRTFLVERMNDPPAKKNQYKTTTDLTSYFFNWMRDKFPTNGTQTHKQFSGNGPNKAGTSEARTNAAKNF